MSVDVLTNIGGIGPVYAWCAYNAGAVVEQQMGVGCWRRLSCANRIRHQDGSGRE